MILLGIGAFILCVALWCGFTNKRGEAVFLCVVAAAVFATATMTICLGD